LAAVVLAGGSARRLGGVAKPALPVGGRPMLLRVLDAVTSAGPRIVVGPPDLARLLPDTVALTREEPPGGGPVAGLAAGVRLVPHQVPRVAVLAADLPFLTRTVLDGLCSALESGTDVAVLVDDAGRRQWLCAVWLAPALRRRLAALDDPAGVPMRGLAAEAVVREVYMPAGDDAPPWFDFDTDGDLRRAEEWLHANS
jgi:molybdopterin-guanine dinucleotide biosynthesis protein A